MDFEPFLIGDDSQLDFCATDFTFAEMKSEESVLFKPKFNSIPKVVQYDNAQQLANRVKLFPGEQLHGIVDGSFIFGDFIEALIMEKDVVCHEMHLSTLSMSQNNIDSLVNLFQAKRLDSLTLLLSNYFYSHEKFRLVKYLHGELARYKYNLMIRRSHTKICLMSVNNIKLVLSGSANLRSSNCIEQIILQESPELYAFYREWFEQQNDYMVVREGEIL